MKKLPFILCAAALVACDEVKVEDRFIELPAIEAQRVVLLEEFTGQLCVNCPQAHEVIHDLLKTYPENLVAVSLHGGGDAFSYHEDDETDGLRTDESQAYCDANNIYSLPNGIVDRVSGAIDKDQWAAAIRAELEKPSKLEISVEAAYNANSDEIEINTTVSPFENLNANLQLWIVEDSIVARQMNGDKLNRRYVHNNVFRGTVNGMDGDKITLKTSQEAQYSHSIVRKEKWNEQNLTVVAFIYDATGVQQACRVAVAIPEE